ncbi:hypothetical protein [Streptosporangium lutulentum]|uniref:Uncharacterized protein n=1 Tax=Streptosporangium lutulentum TaxID=1461250 RepID=A0ABT9QA89_9ACTN|nr:hypothetical protein [Streptosporangium lutulentum]MDP9843305.1 hypothetical protein [Streptosporangium lutulentum]
MTARIWLYDAAVKSPYDAAPEARFLFDVRTVAHARELAAAMHPDAPPLAALVVTRCEYGTCGRTSMISEEHAPTIERARELLADERAFHGGWYQALYQGRLADICQWHYEVDRETNMSQPVGTEAAKRRAAEAAPVGGDQLDLFGSML